MKKFLSVIGILAIAHAAVAADARVNPSNFSGTLNQPIFMADGTTALDTSFKVDVFGGTGNTKGSLTFLKTLSIQITGLFFENNGELTSVTGVAESGLAHFYVRAYNGTSFDDVTTTLSGEGDLFSTRLSSNDLPARSFKAEFDETTGTGFTSFNVGDSMAAVPEPTTVALGVIGGIGMLFRRRRNR